MQNRAMRRLTGPTASWLEHTVLGLLVAAGLAACAAPLPTPQGDASANASLSASPADPPPRSSDPSPIVATAAPSGSLATHAPATPVPVPAGGLLDRLVAAVDAWADDVSLDLVPDTVAGGAQLDGVADDGQGPGRLLVVVSPPGSTAPGNLCADRDFAQGGPCERTALPGGDLIFRRGIVEAGGTQTIVVAIRGADGSGVLVESGNFTIETPPVLVAGEERPTPAIGRPDPVLSLDQAEQLARAVAEATRGCSLRTCP